MAESTENNESTESTENEETTQTEESGGNSDGGGESQAQTEKVNSGDDWKTKARKHENRAKALQSQIEKLTSKVDEFENASKSESEKLTDRATKAESDAKEAAATVARLRVALDKGLTETQAKRLIGETQEELEADADELLASFQKGEKSTEEESKDDADGGEAKDDDNKSKDRRRPKERLKTGATGDTEPEENDPAKLAERVPRGF